MRVVSKIPRHPPCPASGYLRYIVRINDRRTLLRTYRPSESIVAHASAQETFWKPDMCLAIIQAAHRNFMNGVIHIGDIGETVTAVILPFTQDRIQSLYPATITHDGMSVFLAPSCHRAFWGPWKKGCRPATKLQIHGRKAR